MKTILNKKEKVVRISFWVLLLVISFFFLRRLFWGMDIADEVMNICDSFRLVNGNRFLVDVWDFYQLGDSFLSPFVWLYIKISGSTDGIVLACRLFYLALNIGIGCFAYRVMKVYFSNFYSRMAITLGIIFYAPFSMYYLWYDTAGQLFFLIGVLFLMLDMKKTAKVYEILAGVFHAFMVIAYPSAIAIVMTEIIAYTILNKKRENKHYTLFYILGGFIPIVILIVYGITQRFDFYLLNNPVSNINQTAETAVVHYSFLDENLLDLFSRGSTGIISKIWGSVTSVVNIISIKSVVLLIAALVTFILIIRYSWKKEIKWIRAVLFFILGIISLLLSYAFRNEYNRATIFAYMFLTILLIGAIITSKDTICDYKFIMVLAVIPSIVFFPIVSITATHGGSKAFMGLWVLCLMGLGLYIETSKIVLGKMTDYFAPLYILCFIGMVTFLFNNQFFEYQGKSQDMSYQVDHGVYKGLKIPEEYVQYIELEDEIKGIVDDEVESVALFDEYPSSKYMALMKKISMSESGRHFRYSTGVYGLDYADFMTYWERFGFPDILIIKNDPEWYDEEWIRNTPGCNYQRVKASEHYIVYMNKD